MQDTDIAKSINNGKVILKAEFRSGEVVDRSGTKNGKAWSIRRARFNVEVVTGPNSRKPMVLEQRIPDGIDPQKFVFPKTGENLFFDLAITPMDKGGYYIDATVLAGKAA